MNIPKLRDLWRLEGTVGRGAYALCGVVGFALKYLVDWSVARFLFAEPWSPLSYWHLFKLGQTRGFGISTEMFLVLFALSIPFLWFGMSMTLLRLRDAGRSAGWATLFFVPVANVALFVVLSLLPARSGARERDLSGPLSSAFFAILATVGIATLAVALATKAVVTYGLGLFIAVPFCVGYLSAFFQVRRNPAARAQPFVAALLSLALLGGFLLALAWEGVVCLAMAAPLAIVVGLLGACIGTFSGRKPQSPAAAQAFMAAALLPLAIAGEAALHRTPPVYRVDSSIVVNAPPEAVWRNVVSFSDIGGEPEWYFRAGIAYPLRARIDGRGVGAIRHCEFTTGAFVEPITVWNEPSLLRFDVTENPSPMRELSPYRDIDAPHLHGFMISKQGQFELRPLSGGRTLLIGSTWYQHGLWPAPYWRLWSDEIIHAIHLRVLRHVKGLSETGPRSSVLSPQSSVLGPRRSKEPI